MDGKPMRVPDGHHHETMTVTGQCPHCGEQAQQDSVDVGVGVIFGPWGCSACGWSESEDYDGEFGGGVQVDGGYLDPMGNLYPAASPLAQFIRGGG